MRIACRRPRGPRAALLPFKRRDTSVLRPNDVWLIDGHTYKAKVRHPDHGQPFRPELTVAIDAATRRIQGWSVNYSENVIAVGDCMRHAIGQCGVPAILYSDNGGGETAKQIDCPVDGFCARLGIDHRTGLPGHPQGHGLIERSWRTHAINSPWLKLSDADLCALAQPYIDLDRLPGILRESIPLFGYGGRNAHNIFVLLMALVPLVQPGSIEAHDLVLRLERFRNFKISEPNISIGTPYSELEKLNRYKPAPFAPIALSGGYVDRLLDYLRAGVPSNGPAENPLVSAPAIVAQAAQSLEVSEDAACYFLQLLTIAKPTNTLIKKWNSWTPRRLKAASNELLARKLVVTGQRKGAGRTVFLAGGWLHRSQAGPAMEEWKAPHYLLWPDAANQPVIPGCPPLAPYGELFTETWQRYLAGDTPEYEKLQTKHYR